MGIKDPAGIIELYDEGTQNIIELIDEGTQTSGDYGDYRIDQRV